MGLKAYPVFYRSAVDTFGDTEVASSVIARELSKIDKPVVSVLIGNYGQPGVERPGGISLHRSLLLQGGRLEMRDDRYPEEFNFGAVEQVVEPGFPVAQVAERPGITTHCL